MQHKATATRITLVQNQRIPCWPKITSKFKMTCTPQSSDDYIQNYYLVVK